MTQQDPAPQGSLRSEVGWAFASALSIIFQVFAIFVGFIMMGFGAMTTDSCGASGSCSESALQGAGALGTFGPVTVLLASGAFAAVRAHQNKRESKVDDHTPAAILLGGAGIDLLILLGEYSAFSHVNSMKYFHAVKALHVMTRNHLGFIPI